MDDRSRATRGIRFLALVVVAFVGVAVRPAAASAGCTVPTPGAVKVGGTWTYSGTVHILTGSGGFVADEPSSLTYTIPKRVVGARPVRDPQTLRLSLPGFAPFGSFAGGNGSVFVPARHGPIKYLDLVFRSVGGHLRVEWRPDVGSIVSLDLAPDWLCPLGHTPPIVHPTAVLQGQQPFDLPLPELGARSSVTGTLTYDLRVQLPDHRFNKLIPWLRSPWPRLDACAAIGEAGQRAAGMTSRRRGDTLRDCVLHGVTLTGGRTVFVNIGRHGVASFSYDRRSSLGQFSPVGYPRIGVPTYTQDKNDPVFGSRSVWALRGNEVIHVYALPNPDAGERTLTSMTRLVALTKVIARRVPVR